MLTGEFASARFSMDAIEGVFDGFTNGDTWNGGHAPTSSNPLRNVSSKRARLMDIAGSLTTHETYSRFAAKKILTTKNPRNLREWISQ